VRWLAAARPEALEVDPRGPPWIDNARTALEDAILSKELQPAVTNAPRARLASLFNDTPWCAQNLLQELLCSCLVACFQFAAVAHHLYGTVKEFQSTVVRVPRSPARCGRVIPPSL
jgi:hypothetical protein